MLLLFLPEANLITEKTAKTSRPNWPGTNVKETRWNKSDPNYVRRTMNEPRPWKACMELSPRDKLSCQSTVKRTRLPTCSKLSTDQERLKRFIRAE